jgi:hypothetical protein
MNRITRNRFLAMLHLSKDAGEISAEASEFGMGGEEVCRTFIEVAPTREDHVFLRALDFFGALGDLPHALLDPEGAEAIIKALDELLTFLGAQGARRGTSGSEAVEGRAHREAGALSQERPVS